MKFLENGTRPQPPTSRSCLTHTLVLSRIWASHFHRSVCPWRRLHTRQIYEWKISHIWTNYLPEDCCYYVVCMLHIWMSHFTHLNESFVIRKEYVCSHDVVCVLHTWMSHVTRMNELLLIEKEFACPHDIVCTAHIWICHDIWRCRWIRDIFICDMAHMNMWHGTYEYVTWHIWTSRYRRSLPVLMISCVRHIHEWITSHVWTSCYWRSMPVLRMSCVCCTYEWVMWLFHNTDERVGTIGICV